MNKNYTFKTSTYAGDLLYLLPGIKTTCEKAGVKAEIYLWLDRPGKSYEGASHPNGTSMLTAKTLEMLRPLLESQPYIAKVAAWRGEEIKVNLDELREKAIASMMPYGSITRWAGYAWPDMQCDMGRQWLVDFKPGSLGPAYPPIEAFKKREASPAYKKIIINRTSRWKNPMIHYWFLREFKDQIIFAGLPEEHEAFCKEWELEMPLLIVQDFLELAIALASCKFFIGNQSMCFALGEAMKIPRLLEVCQYAPNVIPCGAGGYDFLHQFALEWFVKEKDSPLNRV